MYNTPFKADAVKRNLWAFDCFESLCLVMQVLCTSLLSWSISLAGYDQLLPCCNEIILIWGKVRFIYLIFQNIFRFLTQCFELLILDYGSCSYNDITHLKSRHLETACTKKELYGFSVKLVISFLGNKNLYGLFSNRKTCLGLAQFGFGLSLSWITDKRNCIWNLFLFLHLVLLLIC